MSRFVRLRNKKKTPINILTVAMHLRELLHLPVNETIAIVGLRCVSVVIAASLFGHFDVLQCALCCAYKFNRNKTETKKNIFVVCCVDDAQIVCVCDITSTISHNTHRYSVLYLSIFVDWFGPELLHGS